MHDDYYNGKYNLIILSDYEPKKVPDNVVVRRGKFEDICFQIRKEELDNDEIFTSSLIVNDNFKDIKLEYFFSHDKFFELYGMFNQDNWIYTTDFKHTSQTAYNIVDAYSEKFKDTASYMSDDLLFCNSHILWLLGNRYRTENKNDLYGFCRLHRIEPFIFPDKGIPEENLKFIGGKILGLPLYEKI
jgi:hypothetical protein